MRLKTRIAALGATALIAAGTTFTALPVSGAFLYAPVAGGTTNFNKYLIVEAGSHVPDVDFNFTVTAGQAQSYAVSGSEKRMEIKAGLNPGAVTVSTASFSAADDASLSASATAAQIDVQRTVRNEGQTPVVKFETSKGEKFAVKPVNVNFSAVEFPEPGIYRYIVTENGVQADTDRGIIHDDDTARVLDVYVTDDVSNPGRLVVSSYVLHMHETDPVVMNATNGSGDQTADGAPVADKTDGFTNEYFSSDLAVRNEVAGNQASRDKYFKYTVAFTGLTEGDVYTVSYGDDSNGNTLDGSADQTINANPNAATTCITSNVNQPATLTAQSGGKITQDFYLQHGQSIVIRGLPQNANYKVTEKEEDYKKEAAAVTGYTDTVGTAKIADVLAAKSAAVGDNVLTSYKNTRAGVIPTGIFMATGAGIMVLLSGLAGLIGLNVRKRRAEKA